MTESKHKIVLLHWTDDVLQQIPVRTNLNKIEV